MLLLFFLLNLGISWFNAYSVGRSWADSKAVGGWPRFLTWCGAIMSAAGFTWCYLILLALFAHHLDYLDPKHLKLMLELGYVILIFPVLGSGLAIWMDSLTTAWRRRDAVSTGVALWNTYAQAHNTYEAIKVLPGIFESIGDAFSSDSDSDDAKGLLLLIVVALVLIALSAGILTTIAIIRSTTRRYSHEVSNEFRRLPPKYPASQRV